MKQKAFRRYRPWELMNASSVVTLRIWPLSFGGFPTPLWEKCLFLPVAAMVAFLNSWFVFLALCNCDETSLSSVFSKALNQIWDLKQTYLASPLGNVFSLTFLHSFCLILILCYSAGFLFYILISSFKNHSWDKMYYLESNYSFIHDPLEFTNPQLIDESHGRGWDV